MFQGIAHIGFTVTDLDRSVEFYRDVLGLSYQGEMLMDGPETASLFDRPGCRARVAYLREADHQAPPVELIQFLDQPCQVDQPSLFKTSISELCFSTDDIDAEYARLMEKGVRFLSEPQTFDSTAYGFGKSRAVYFFDPDGNVLELIQPMD